MERGIKSLGGPLFFATFALLLLGGAYAMWPPDFFSSPLAGMTNAALLRAVASSVLAIIGLEFLCALAIVVLSDS
jgi:hypothetical protein